MNWDTLKLIWTRLTEQLGFHRVRSDEYRDRRTNAETSMSDQGTKSLPYHPDFSRKAPRVFTAHQLLKER
jgi:hypothetical protein